MAFQNGCGFETAGWAETGTLSLLTERHVNDFRFVGVVETLRGVGPFFVYVDEHHVDSEAFA